MALARLEPQIAEQSGPRELLPPHPAPTRARKQKARDRTRQQGWAPLLLRGGRAACRLPCG
eukprot:7375742-Alexandrium_andersonii.AAC.1